MNKGLVHQRIFTEFVQDTANHNRLTEYMAEKLRVLNLPRVMLP